VALWNYRVSPFLFALDAGNERGRESSSFDSRQATTTSATVIQNHGFGVAHHCTPSRADCPSFASIYPSANTYQFLAFYTSSSSSQQQRQEELRSGASGGDGSGLADRSHGVYFATHDPVGTMEVRGCFLFWFCLFILLFYSFVVLNFLAFFSPLFF
jgi:hypothetical protein